MAPLPACIRLFPVPDPTTQWFAALLHLLYLNCPEELIFSGQGVFFRTGLALGRGYATSSCMIPGAAGGGFWALSAAAVALSTHIPGFSWIFRHFEFLRTNGINSELWGPTEKLVSKLCTKKWLETFCRRVFRYVVYNLSFYRPIRKNHHYLLSGKIDIIFSGHVHTAGRSGWQTDFKIH
jgi:hypothetical protein